ncbi:pirin, n-terminal:pirin, c-terminal [hydrocarbon metagenome]|uniref:Pirin, n-terminal:pirin, c-terminal n=1 Tax=hydrocarbon metagenome TaxID=938273 RepID=A0A0W8ESU6_9ZZZZ
MPQNREIATRFTSRETIEGAGVRLRRAFGFSELPLFDPFLMLDDFRAERPEDYLAGFPWHPHRGIETVTYMLAGRVEHGDSMGNAGSVDAGSVQWMTAGSGIIHQEMPKPINGAMGGFQLWVNLPSRNKMMDPRYQEIPADGIPVVRAGNDVTVKVISGSFGGVTGPVRDIVADPAFLDLTVPAGARFGVEVKEGYTVFAYVIGGRGAFDRSGREAVDHDLVLFSDGDRILATAIGTIPFRFLLISGKPIREPIAWRGPIVMNTEEELRQAFREYRDGTFVRARKR